MDDVIEMMATPSCNTAQREPNLISEKKKKRNPKKRTRPTTSSTRFFDLTVDESDDDDDDDGGGGEDGSDDRSSNGVDSEYDDDEIVYTSGADEEDKEEDDARELELHRRLFREEDEDRLLSRRGDYYPPSGKRRKLKEALMEEEEEDSNGGGSLLTRSGEGKEGKSHMNPIVVNDGIPLSTAATPSNKQTIFDVDEKKKRKDEGDGNRNNKTRKSSRKEGGGAFATADAFIPNKQQAYFLERVFAPHRPSIFLTGIPGAGKSAVVSQLREEIIRLLGEDVATLEWPITATTAMAASLHVGGRTINSTVEMFRDLPERISPKASRIIREMKVCIIDEISMMHPTYFANVSALFKRARTSELPFGGVQLILVGDFFQLPPVITKDDPLFKLYNGQLDKIPLLFELPEWRDANIETIILDETFRQAGDSAFNDLLAEVRVASLSGPTQAVMLSRQMTVERFKREYVAARPGVPDIEKIEPTMLYTMRAAVEQENLVKLIGLNGDVQSYQGQYVEIVGEWSALITAIGNDSFSHLFEHHLCDHQMKQEAITMNNRVNRAVNYRKRRMWYQHNSSVSSNTRRVEQLLAACADHRMTTPFFLHLKVGAQVVCTVNMPNGPINGLRGVVVGFATGREYGHNWRSSSKRRKKKKQQQQQTDKGKKKETAITNDNNPNAIPSIYDDYDSDEYQGDEDNNNHNNNNGEGDEEEDEMDVHTPAMPHLACPVTCPLHEVSSYKDEMAMFHGQDHASLVNQACYAHITHLTRWPIVRFVNGKRVHMRPSSMQIEVASTHRRPKASVYMLAVPLRLAWAETIHSAQGQTLTYGYLNLSNHMSNGQVYVAISRFPSLDSVAWRGYTLDSVKAHPRVIAWWYGELEKKKERERELKRKRNV